MVMYVIMSFMVGFTGNKLFNKNNIGIQSSIKWGFIIGSILIMIHAILDKFVKL
ncbi:MULTISPECIES: hypothetical protein [Clostridium]|uniref:Uncharacterized protein n=2 Tax=Clostridium TaxID=1485 RepID=D8GK31_CLOLD|nr:MULTISPECIES: hypothetical protein [Clostridium]ADK13149.1 hypothetical protein CLJU_c00420 [Clostridium ljungdahlii DSM 13528]AGY76373.1 hypothetical protein CAETHG_2160 [Clostridium autoethanogenum DSM 10061]ALU36536.1 Hypothetical protein CLAU_2107 [Clostridium autoethanogenum DSM 10061]OAA84388.1 hypothetical protein WX45_01051 [Clostridium ljungdahlii DSM 13528]OVY48622.1 hypothetical protein WX72_00443 [Clostridium autoethanogenum]